MERPSRNMKKIKNNSRWIQSTWCENIRVTVFGLCTRGDVRRELGEEGEQRTIIWRSPSRARKKKTLSFVDDSTTLHCSEFLLVASSSELSKHSLATQHERIRLKERETTFDFSDLHREGKLTISRVEMIQCEMS